LWVRAPRGAPARSRPGWAVRAASPESVQPPGLASASGVHVPVGVRLGGAGSRD